MGIPVRADTGLRTKSPTAVPGVWAGFYLCSCATPPPPHILKQIADEGPNVKQQSLKEEGRVQHAPVMGLTGDLERPE